MKKVVFRKKQKRIFLLLPSESVDGSVLFEVQPSYSDQVLTPKNGFHGGKDTQEQIGGVGRVDEDYWR